MSKLKTEAIELWKQLGNTPINENEEIDEPFHIFEKGTHREHIWHWFEEEYNLSVTELMFKTSY